MSILFIWNIARMTQSAFSIGIAQQLVKTGR